ncbi:MAG: Catalase, partial [Arthrobacter sp.]|nr:Catalase [Arthrobacter sp.]
MTQNISAPAVSTTQSGAPVTSDAHSQATGADGAIILTDHYLIEKLA